MANWWEDNVLIEPVGKLEAEQRLLARREQEFEQKRQEEAERQINYPQGLMGDLRAQHDALAMEVRADVYSPVARVLGQDEIADELNRNAAAIEAAIVKRETNQDPAQRPEGAPPLGPQIPDWLQRNVRGGLRSVPPIVIGGRLGMMGGGAVAGATGASIGGTTGAIGTAMGMEGNQAITEGRDAGLEGTELAAYAASQAAIEGAVAGAFSAVGLGGAEAIFARNAISGGVRQAAKQAAARVGQEIPEEITTEIAHAIAADYAGTRPDGLTEEALAQLAFDTTIQTIVTMGAMEGPRLAAEALQGRQQQPGEQLTPERMAEIEEFQKVQAERERLAREQQEQQDHPGAMPLPDDNLSPNQEPAQQQPAQQGTGDQSGVPAETTVTPTAGETSNVPSVQPAQPREEVIQNDTTSEEDLQQGNVQRDQEGLRDEEGGQGQVGTEPTVPDSPQQDAGNTVTPESSAEGGRTSPPSVPTQDSSQGSGVRRGEVGGKLAAGESVLTNTGRQTTPFPKLDFDSERKTGNTLKRVDAWLRENAIEEARSRGDDFNLTAFEGTDLKNLSQSDKDSFEYYLFDPDFVFENPPKLTRPVDSSRQPGTRRFGDPEIPVSDAPVSDVAPDDSQTESSVADETQTGDSLSPDAPPARRLGEQEPVTTEATPGATSQAPGAGDTLSPVARVMNTKPAAGMIADIGDVRKSLGDISDQQFVETLYQMERDGFIDLTDHPDPAKGLSQEDIRRTMVRGGKTPDKIIFRKNAPPVPDAAPANDFEVNRDGAIAKVKNLWGQTVVPREPKNADEQDQMDFLRSRGRQAAFVDGDDASFSGALDESTGFMLIAGNRDTNDIWRTIGHEMAHATALDKVIPVDSTELVEGRKKRLARAKTPYRKRLEAEPELLDREARADIVGEFMRDKAFRDKISSENPTLWERLREAVLKVVGKWTPRNEAQALVLAELRKQSKPDTGLILPDGIMDESDESSAAEIERRMKDKEPAVARKFSYQNGRVQVEVPPPYQVGGKSVQPFVFNGKTYTSAEAFKADAEEAYNETIKRYPDLAAPQVVPSTDAAKPQPAVKKLGDQETPSRDDNLSPAQEPELDEAAIDEMMEGLYDAEYGPQGTQETQAPEPTPPRKLGQPEAKVESIPAGVTSTAKDQYKYGDISIVKDGSMFTAQLSDTRQVSDRTLAGLVRKVDATEFKPSIEPAPKPPTRTEQARDAVRKKKADLYKRWNDEAKGKLTSGLDPSLAKLAFDIAVAEIQDGTLTFAAYVENVAGNVSADLLEKAKPYFESAWRVAHKRGMTEDPAGKFDDVLAAKDTGDNLSPDRKLGDVDYGTVDSPNRVALGEHFAERFRDGASYARITDARKEAAELIGGTPKDGTQAIKAIDESIELGVVMVARDIAQSGEPDAAIYDQLVDLYSRQPNLGTRTSTSMLNQAYSTPAPLAFVANRQAGITQDDTVYDSSAGNGMLLIVGGERIANELNPDRVAALEAQGIETTSNDATEFTLGNPITALAINPPFGELKNEDGSKKQWNIDGTRTDRIDHAITLKSLSEIPDNGKVAIIIGAKGFEQRKPKENKARGRAYLKGKGFYDAVYDNYNVVDHYTVHGDLYSRQGAAFPVDVIIIKGRGASSRPKPYNITGGGIPQVFNSWQELKDAKLLGTERGPDSTTESRPTDDEQAGVPAETDGIDESGPAGQREGTGGTEQPADRGGRRLGDDESLGRPSETPSVPEQDQSDVGTGGRSTDRGGRDQQRPATNVGGDAGQRTGGTKNNDAGRDGLNQGQEAVADEESEVKGDQYQTGYTPSSSNRAIGALIPNNHQTAVQSALDAVADRYGNIDEFVANELGIDNDQLFDAFSAEQVDALALGMARHKEGKAFILGDQTGVGKGRVAAGMMIYAKRQGFAPVFMTEKPTLYADMIRDMIDIGFSTDAKPFNPLMTNYTSKKEDQIALPDGRLLKQTSGAAATRVPEAIENFLAGNGLVATTKKATKKSPAQTEEYDAIFTTYDQMKTVQGVLKERHMSLQQLSPKAFFVLDESHNAGGSAQDSDRQQSDDSDDPRIPVAQMVRDLIAADTAGVYFSSATFAKRHSVMDLYAKTGMTAATGEDGASLASAIAAGGVPLQQVVSQQLVESGAYLRRERSFDGVEFSPKVYDVPTEGAEQSAAIFRAINAFDKIKQQVLEAELDEDVISEGGRIRPDWATGEAGMTSTNFSSILWNLTDQMLLATKADSIADEAIASLERGESPVIYVDSTMEASLNAYIEASGLKPGEQSDFSFRDLLQRYLERSREVLVQRDVEDPDSYEQVRLTDEQLGERGLAAFNAAQELIDNFDAAIPASPIDWIRKRIEDAGYSFGEYTGRQSVMRYDDINTATLEQRPGEEVGASNRIEMVRKFNAGELDVLLFNQSGSTGISMHASEKFANQKRRHMIIGQSAKNIDTFMQSLGRVHRTGQVVEPKFTLAMTNLPAEVRPASVLVKKLASLNANVTASDKGSVSFDIADVMNSIGDRIVADYLSENDELNRALNEGEDEGLVGMTKAGTPKVIDGIARKASGRMAIMPLETQQEFWDNVTETFNDMIEELDRMGANPLSAQVSELDARTIESFPIFDGDPEADNAFERPAYIEKVTAKRPGKPMTPDEVRKKVEDFYSLPESAGEPELRKAATDWQRATIQEAMDLVADRIQTIRELGTTRGDEESRITARIQREEAVLNEFASMIRAFAPGLSVSIWEGGATETLDVIPGVVLGIERKGKGGHPASMSKWRVEIAMGSPDRVMRMSLSQLRASMETEGDTSADAREQSQESYRIFSNRSLIDDSTLKDFEESEVSTVETRYIGTGNILAAFNIFREKRGRVTFFRDNEGNLRRGVLLPRRFNVDQWAKERPVVMDDVNQIRQFLSAGNYLETPDRALNVMMIRGGLVVRAPKSKARGGKYTLNPTILEASAPQEFVSIGARMEMVIDDPAQQDSVLESILAVAPLQATSEKELARRIKNGDDSDDRPDVIRAFAAPTAQAQPGGASGDSLSPTSPPSSQRRLGDGTGDNLSSNDPVRQADIVTTWSRLFDVPIRIGGYVAKAGKQVRLGIYHYLEEIVRMREGNAFNIIVASHEVGHHIDKKMNLYSGDKKKSKLTQLKKDDPKRHAKVRAQLQALDYDYPNSTRVDEGIAEAVRQIITGTAKNARLAPEAVAWVEEQIMADPKFGPAMKQAVEQAKQYKDQGAIKRAQMVFGGAPMDLDDRVRRRNLLERSIAWLYKGFVDRRYTLNLVDADIAAKKPLEPGEATIHEMVTVFDSRVNAMSAKALQDGIHTIDGEKISDATIPGAQELLKKGEYTADADAYMVARFGLTLPASYNFSMDRQDAQEYVEWVESDADRAPRWQEYHKLHSEYFNAMVELEVRDGDLTREEADRIMGTNKDLYIPLMREMGNSRFGKMIGGGGQMIELPKRFQRRTQSGSGRPVMPIIQQAVLRTRHHYSRVVRQQIHNKIVEQMTAREGLGKWLSRIDPRTAIEGGQIQAILQQLVDKGVVDPEFAFVLRQAQKVREGGKLQPDELDRLAEHYEIEQTTDIVAQEDEVHDRLSLEPDITEAVLFYKPDYRRPNGMYVIKYMRGDKPELYEVDPDFYDTLLGLPQETHSFYISAADWINSKFKTGAVGVNTTFAVSELGRNVQTFAVNSKYATGSDRVTKTAAWTADYVAAITHLPLVHKPNELVEVYREWGGELYNYISPDAKGSKKTARRLGSSANRKKFASASDAYHTLADGMEDMVDRVRVLAAVSDVGPRLAEAEAYLKTQGFVVKDGKFVDAKTGDPKMPTRDQFIKAMYAAADVTYNYRRMGKWIRPIERIFPFSNAAIQALDKRVRTYRETLQGLGKKKGAERTIAKQAFLFMMAISTMYVMIKWAMMDDEEELDQWEKDGYLTVKVPGIDGRFSVAMSREHAWPANGALAGIRYFLHDEKDALSKYFRQELDNTVPFGASGAVGTSVEGLMNFDTFRWQPIEPNYMRYGDSAVSPKYRFDEQTTELSKVLGKTNVLSPKMIDHLFNGYTGGAWKRWNMPAEKAVVPMLQALGTAEKADTQPWSLRDVPGLRALYRDNTPNASVNEFYDEMGRLSLEMNNMKAEGQVPPTEMIERSEMLSQAADVMQLLRESSGPEYDSSQNRVAVARDVLGKSDHANYPNPFYTDIPEEAAKKIRQMVFNDLDNLSRDLGRPSQSGEQSDEEYANAIRVWEAKQDGKRKYWEKHFDSPIVQDALKGVKSQEKFRDILLGRGKPRLGNRKFGDFAEDFRRFGQRQEAAREFLRFGQGATQGAE